MNIENTTFVEYISRKELINIFYFIEKYEYEDFLNISLSNIRLKCIKLDIKLLDSSNDGHGIKYLIIYKIY